MTEDPGLASAENERYRRQTALRGFGPAGQARLRNASILVVGAGGLGCAALPYLAAAGVGRIGVADDDAIALDNLHRQTLYATAEVGEAKAAAAARRLRALNPGIAIESRRIRIDAANADAIVAAYGLVLDASDNPETRYVLDDACARLGRPLVFGAISDYEGQVAVFHHPDADGRSSRYRDFFPEAPRAGEIRNCAETGVLGVLPGVIGAMQAAEALKILSGCGPALGRGLLTYSALTQETAFFRLPPAAGVDSPARTDRRAPEPTPAPPPSRVREIAPSALADLLARGDVAVIDVREAGERPVFSGPHLGFPLSRLDRETPDVRLPDVVLVCRSGARSRRAGELLADRLPPGTRIHSLTGGVAAWEGKRE